MRSTVLVLVVVCVLAAGCRPGTSGIVGKWVAGGFTGGTFEFGADGRVKIVRPGYLGSTWYRVQGDRMTVGHLSSGAPDETITFKLSGDKLVLGSCLALGTMGATPCRRVRER